MAQLLSQVAVGTVVKLNESNSPVQFYVACQDYESGLNGAGRTLLVRKNGWEKIKYTNLTNGNAVTGYEGNNIDSSLNSTYIALLDQNIKDVVGTTSIYVLNGTWGNNNLITLSRAVFALSATEFGFNPWNGLFAVEGSALPNPSILRAASDGTPQWSRSRSISANNMVVNIQTNDFGAGFFNESYLVKPAFTLPGSTTYVLDDGTITLNQPPAAPGSITVPTVAAGQPCAITWTAATDPDGTIASYTLQRSVNGSGWTQVFSGNALTYTDTIGNDWGTVAYQVCAVDNYGAAGPFATSATQTVQDGILYISGPAPALGQQISPFTVSFTTGVSGDTSTVSTALTVSLDGNQIYNDTVNTGVEVTLNIDTRVIGGGNHTIEASATADSYIGATQSYTFSTLSFTLPDGGYGEQLQDSEGNVIFPQSVASLIGGLNGTVANDIAILNSIALPAYNAIFNPTQNTIWESWTITPTIVAGSSTTIFNSSTSNPNTVIDTVQVSNQATIGSSGTVELVSPSSIDVTWNNMPTLQNYTYVYRTGSPIITNVVVSRPSNYTFNVSGNQVSVQNVRNNLPNVESSNPNAYPDDGQVDGVYYRKIGLTPSVAKVETGSYVGTGTNGQSNPNTLQFSYPPKLVIIFQNSPVSGQYYVSMGILVNNSPVALSRFFPYNSSGYGNTNDLTVSGLTTSWEENTVSWWYANTSYNNSANQLNSQGITYSYVAIG